MPEATIDTKKFPVNLKIIVSAGIGLVIISNTFTLQMERLSYAEKETARVEKEAGEKLIQVEAAGRRRLANQKETTRLENRIIFLEFILDECNAK